MNKNVETVDLGLIDYKAAWDYQTGLFNKTLADKSSAKATKNYLIFCEHPNVYTLGKSGNEKNLLVPIEQLDASYYPINRGGDITFHGPGQIVVYPILDLDNFFTDIHKYMRFLEEAVIQTLAEFKIAATRIRGLTGVWIDIENNPRKICAFGVKTSRWVTMHGLALNVNTDLNYFGHIIACGIADKDKSVTSMEKELGHTIDISKVKSILKDKIISLFEMHEERYQHTGS